MAAIFDFNGSGRLWEKKNLHQGGGRRSKIRRGVGVGVGIEDYWFLLMFFFESLVNALQFCIFNTETQRDIHQRATDELADAGLEGLHLR